MSYRWCDPRLPERFWSKVHIAASCWVWSGANSGGKSPYGIFYLGGAGSRRANKRQYRRAHRVAYEALVRPIPPGFQLDHLCRRTDCVNPAHLEAVTQRENILRGRGPEVAGRRNASKQECPKGHPYGGDNLYVNPKGERFCRACKRASDRRRYESRRAP